MKFKKEKYIIQRQTKSGTYTFLVRIRSDLTEITKSFNEFDYGSAREAYENAVRFRNKALVDIAEGNVLKASSITVRECFDMFMETTVLCYSTKHKHEILFNKYIVHKNTPIQKLTRANIVDDLNAMVDVATNETITRVLSIWRKDIIETAINNEFIQRDLTLGLNAPESHIYTTRKNTSTNRDLILKVEDILWNSTTNPYKCKIIYYMLEVMYYTGMRPAECEVLQREDFHDGYISITKELGSNKDKKDIVRRPKTQTSIRNIPIHPNLRPIIKELLKFSINDFVFADEDGKFINSTAIGSIITNRIKTHGLKFNMYMLRHNLATELITNKVDDKTTMELLGHKNFNMSLYYANSNDKLKEDAIEVIA